MEFRELLFRKGRARLLPLMDAVDVDGQRQGAAHRDACGGGGDCQLLVHGEGRVVRLIVPGQLDRVGKGGVVHLAAAACRNRGAGQ